MIPKIYLKKSLGQNFLQDKNIINKIVGLFKIDNSNIIEIGSGSGAITENILNSKPNFLISIEKDCRFFQILKEKFKNNQSFEILNEDATKLDLKKIKKIEKLPKKSLIIVGNLPYNVGTLILLNLFQQNEFIVKMIIMLQLEVVNRFCAIPKTKEYGKISVLAQALFDVKKQFEVSKNCFNPVPQVTSAVMTFNCKTNMIDTTIYHRLIKFTTIAFSMKRKKIKTIFKHKNINFTHHLIQDNTRAEELSVEDFIEISKTFAF